MKKLKAKRFVIYDNIHGYFTHGDYTNKYYAIKVAESLSKSLKVHVVDTENNFVVWG